MCASEYTIEGDETMRWDVIASPPAESVWQPYMDGPADAERAKLTPFKVFLNEEVDEDGRFVGFWGYKPEHKLELVWDGVEKDIDLETIWAMFNRGSGTFVGDTRYPKRSLSVGDVVELDGTRYAVEGVGWKQIREFEFNVDFGDEHGVTGEFQLSVTTTGDQNEAFGQAVTQAKEDLGDTYNVWAVKTLREVS